jgi:hypothetical protein
MSLITDIFVTTKGGHRPHLLQRSLESLFECTDRSLFRLTVVEDGWEYTTHKVVDDLDHDYGIDHVLIHSKNMGLGPSINQALAHIDAMKYWDNDSGNLLTVYCQDDVLYSKGWLDTLSKKYFQLLGPLKLGFASGVECPEHPITKDLGNGIILKDWIRATNLMALHSYWMSMYPIGRIDPETGRERGRPHDGLGSGVDWHFIRQHHNSVCRTGRTNLVIPGLLIHDGFDQSTWLKRELPESYEDRLKIDELRKLVKP